MSGPLPPYGSLFTPQRKRNKNKYVCIYIFIEMKQGCTVYALFYIVYAGRWLQQLCYETDLDSSWLRT